MQRPSGWGSLRPHGNGPLPPRRAGQGTGLGSAARGSPLIPGAVNTLPANPTPRTYWSPDCRPDVPCPGRWQGGTTWHLQDPTLVLGLRPPPRLPVGRTMCSPGCRVRLRLLLAARPLPHTLPLTPGPVLPLPEGQGQRHGASPRNLEPLRLPRLHRRDAGAAL